MAEREESGEQLPTMTDVFEEVLTILHESSEAPPAEDIDYDQAIEELEHSLSDLREKTEQIYQQTGMSREQLDEYSGNPDNFSKEEWVMLEKVRGELREIQADADEVMGTSSDTQKKARRTGRSKKWLKS